MIFTCIYLMFLDFSGASDAGGRLRATARKKRRRAGGWKNRPSRPGRGPCGGESRPEGPAGAVLGQGGTGAGAPRDRIGGPERGAATGGNAGPGTTPGAADARIWGGRARTTRIRGVRGGPGRACRDVRGAPGGVQTAKGAAPGWNAAPVRASGQGVRACPRARARAPRAGMTRLRARGTGAGPAAPRCQARPASATAPPAAARWPAAGRPR